MSKNVKLLILMVTFFVSFSSHAKDLSIFEMNEMSTAFEASLQKQFLRQMSYLQNPNTTQEVEIENFSVFVGAKGVFDRVFPLSPAVASGMDYQRVGFDVKMTTLEVSHSFKMDCELQDHYSKGEIYIGKCNCENEGADLSLDINYYHHKLRKFCNNDRFSIIYSGNQSELEALHIELSDRNLDEPSSVNQ